MNPRSICEAFQKRSRTHSKQTNTNIHPTTLLIFRPTEGDDANVTNIKKLMRINDKTLEATFNKVKELWTVEPEMNELSSLIATADQKERRPASSKRKSFQI